MIRRISLLLTAGAAMLALSATMAFAQIQTSAGTINFEVDTEGQVPADTTFTGFYVVPNTPDTPSEVQLTDPDGDGTYTGTASSAIGGEGVVSANDYRVRIDQAPKRNVTTIAGPETITLSDGETETVSASIDFGGSPGNNPQGETIYGTAGSDYLTDTAGNDAVYALGSGDTVSAGNGDDSLYGGAGWDYVIGGSGNDVLYGWKGSDWLGGTAGNDYVSGWTGSDRVGGGAGDDTVYGGVGNDGVYGFSGNDDLYGWKGSDYLYSAGDGAYDFVSGGPGHDVCVAGPTDYVVGCEEVYRQ